MVTIFNDLLKIEGADPPAVFAGLHHNIFMNVSHLLDLSHGAGNVGKIRSAYGVN